MSDQDPLELAVAVPATSSRRALLAAGLGSAVGFVAAALGRPRPVYASNNDPMTLGITNLASNPTTLLVTTASIDAVDIEISGLASTAVHAVATGGSGVGVHAEASNGTAVRAVSDSGNGVDAWSQTSDGIQGRTYQSGRAGVIGYGNADGAYGVEGSSTGIGVFGSSASSIGVSGVSTNWIGVAGSSGSTFAVYGEANGSGSGAIGVHGTSAAGVGMLGKSRAAAQPGAIGWSGGNSTGLQGFSNDNTANPPAPRAKTGVYGQAKQDATSRGVLGVSGSGDGVRGEATSGAALRGTASSKAGYGVRSSGRLRFEKVSGVATILANQTSVVVTPGTDVTTESFVLLTAKANIGTRSLYFSTDATNDTITIRMSSSRTTATPVAWLLLS
jgi:hypothetical protein